MHSSPNNVHRHARETAQQPYRREGKPAWEMLVESVAIGAVIMLTKAAMRHFFHGDHFGQQGRDR
jgi:hypothetical protein